MSDGSNCFKCALLRWCGGKQRRNIAYDRQRTFKYN